MIDDTLRDIVNLCLELDQKSSEIYDQLATLAEQVELQHFWKEMSEEEQLHVDFWKGIAELAENRMLPQVFEDPEKTKDELTHIYKKVGVLWNTFKQSPTISDAFFLAFRMEFYLLHPAMGTLFHYMKGVGGENNPEDTYEFHLEKLMGMLGKYGDLTPELELLSETIGTLWERNRELARKSSTDELTGVFNRRGFFDTITPLLHLSARNKHPVGVMMTDIDDFKKVNDMYGHQEGDGVLTTVAAALRSNVRASDIVGRYGGEEFIIFFYEVKKDTILRIAEKIRAKIERDTKYDIPVTVSIGIAQGVLSPAVEEEILTLITSADECLYRAKRRGKNKVVID